MSDQPTIHAQALQSNPWEVSVDTLRDRLASITGRPPVAAKYVRREIAPHDRNKT